MNKWQRNLLQKDEPDVEWKVWEVLLYGACFVIFLFVALSKI